MVAGKPVFSVIIPTLAERKYLRDTLESVKRQNFDDYEVIVCDYGSKDGTVQIAKEYGARIVYVDKPGASAAKNEGAVNARGKYLVFLDADTTMWPNCLLLFKRACDAGAAGGFPLIEFNTKNQVYGLFRTLIANPIYVLLSVFGSPITPTNCCFYDREVFMQSNGFDEKTQLFSNVDLNSFIKKYGKVKAVTQAKCFTSDRRIKKAGLFSYCLTVAYAFLMKTIKGKVMPLDLYEQVR